MTDTGITTLSAENLAAAQVNAHGVSHLFCVFCTDKTVLILDTREAIRQAMELSRTKKLPVLGAGSFYLAAEIYAYVRHFQN